MATMTVASEPLNEFPSIKIGDRVQATVKLADALDKVIVAKRGDTGLVIALNAGALPVIYWNRTGRHLDAVPVEEFMVLVSADNSLVHSEIGDLVRARKTFKSSRGQVVARRGHLGIVVYKQMGCLPQVRWQGGLTSEAIPHKDFDLQSDAAELSAQDIEALCVTFGVGKRSSKKQ